MAMTLLSGSNDIGFYVGAMTNMVFNDSETMIWRLKSFLKTSGWSVAAYGKGDSHYRATGSHVTPAVETGVYSDPFTSASLFYTGAVETLDTDRGRCWFVMTQPNNSRSLCFQRVNGTVSALTWRIKYSPGGFAISGTLLSSSTPGPITSSDEVTSIGGGTDAVPTFQQLFETSTNTTKVHAMAQSESPSGFWMAAYLTAGIANSGSGRTAIALDPLLSGSYPLTDPDPYVVYIRYGTNGGNNPPYRINSMGDTTGSPPFASMREGVNNITNIIPVAALKYTDGSTNVCIPAGFVSSAYSGNDELFPIPYARAASLGNVSGWKGISTLFKWNAFNRVGGETVTTGASGSRDYIVLCESGALGQWSGEVVLP